MHQFDPPAHLSERAAALWRAVVPSRARSAGRLAMVQVALEALDRADAARLAIGESGMVSTTKTTGAVHINPLVKVERENRQQFVSTWDRLHLDWDPSIDGTALDRALDRMAEESEEALEQLQHA